MPHVWTLPRPLPRRCGVRLHAVCAACCACAQLRFGGLRLGVPEGPTAGATRRGAAGKFSWRHQYDLDYHMTRPVRARAPHDAGGVAKWFKAKLHLKHTTQNRREPQLEIWTCVLCSGCVQCIETDSCHQLLSPSPPSQCGARARRCECRAC